MRIGIYGGTFNPIHIAHMQIADAAARALSLDRVLFIPAANPYMKNRSELVSYQHRKNMVAIAANNDARFEVRDDDVSGNAPTYTSITVENIRAEYPEAELFLILGEDSFIQLDTWHDTETIFKNITGIYVYRRNDTSLTNGQLITLYPGIQVIASMPSENLDISSTIIRYRLRHKFACKYLMPNGVYDYIENNKLYSMEA